MQKHPMDTHGLSRSPIRAIFQNIPRNLRGGAGGPGQREPNGARVNAPPSSELVGPPPPRGPAGARTHPCRESSSVGIFILT